ncbi:MAG: hypothetical protein ACLVJ6_13225 [Merdibacter sp.]
MADAFAKKDCASSTEPAAAQVESSKEFAKKIMMNMTSRRRL